LNYDKLPLIAFIFFLLNFGTKHSKQNISLRNNYAFFPLSLGLENEDTVLYETFQPTNTINLTQSSRTLA